MSDRAARIRALLTDHFAPISLQIDDQSALHAGHAGAAPGGETHYAIRLVSHRFEGQNRVARTRQVYEILHQEIETGLHALSLKLQSPTESAAAPGK